LAVAVRDGQAHGLAAQVHGPYVVALVHGEPAQPGGAAGHPGPEPQLGRHAQPFREQRLGAFAVRHRLRAPGAPFGGLEDAPPPRLRASRRARANAARGWRLRAAAWTPRSPSSRRPAGARSINFSLVGRSRTTIPTRSVALARAAGSPIRASTGSQSVSSPSS